MTMADDDHIDADPRWLRYPVEFDDWPTHDQIQHIAEQFNRRGLLTQVLLLSGRDISEREIDGDTQLTKDDLAAIYHTLSEVHDAE